MRITIIAPGSRGDVQPYVALGKGLVQAGHAVRLVTTRDHAALVEEHGLELRAVEMDVQAELGEAKTRASFEGGKLLASFGQMIRIARRGAFVTVPRPGATVPSTGQ